MARPSTPSRPASLLPAALLVTDATALPQEYALTMVNGIGRSDENQIQIIKPGISRAHAVVRAVAGGFVIKDLDSQNGTFVNGERATECQLADGDIVEVGTVRFVFRMPWPAPDAPATPGGRPTGKR
jgi:pSer/pThr/pTyr-binding forkhead associated (FHA) protein